MNKSTKNWLITATFLVVSGLLIFTVVMAVLNFNFKKLDTNDYKKYSWETSETFDKISIDVKTEDINFVMTDDEKCTDKFCVNMKVKHTVNVSDNTLTIKTTDKRKWYDFINIAVSFDSPCITIYLPQKTYNSIVVKNHTGDINVRDINVENIDFSVSTGEITLTSVTCNGKLKLSGRTGDMNLKNVISSQLISVKSSTGDIELKNCDAPKLTLKTSTGDIEATLLSDKIFTTKSSTGDIDVPKSSGNDTCEATTSTGDIEIEIK